MTGRTSVVAVDCFWIREQGKGLDRIARNFVRMLSTAPPRWSFVLLGIGGAAWSNVAVPDNARLALYPRSVSRTLWYRVLLPRLLRPVQPNVVHGLADFLPRAMRCATVLTVTEDPARRLATEPASRSPVGRLKGNELRRAFQSSLRRSGQVIAISHVVARDLASRYSYPSSRLRVAHPGVEPTMLAAPVVDPQLGRYFLVFRTGDRRERWPLVLEAFALARRAEPDLRLVAVGCPNTELRQAHGGVTHLGRVSDIELANLFRHALALVDASSFEGFGLQVLEACHFGTPIIAADLPTVREIAGSTALTHAAPSPEWLASVMRRVSAQRERFIPASKVDSSWEAFARQSWAAYEDAVDFQQTRSTQKRMWAWWRSKS